MTSFRSPLGAGSTLEGDYERALEVLADLSEAKQLVRETDELAQRITAALSAPNRVSVFSDLRRQRERTTGLRNRAARARGTLISSEAQARGNRQGEAARVRSRRQELQAEVMKMPVDTEDFIDRDFDKLEEYRLAERELQGCVSKSSGSKPASSHRGRGWLPSIPRRSTERRCARQLNRARRGDQTV